MSRDLQLRVSLHAPVERLHEKNALPSWSVEWTSQKSEKQ